MNFMEKSTDILKLVSGCLTENNWRCHTNTRTRNANEIIMIVRKKKWKCHICQKGRNRDNKNRECLTENNWRRQKRNLNF